MFSERGGTLAVLEVKSICLNMGVNQKTFYHYLVNSPIISRYAQGVYGPRRSLKQSG
jgi:hypothetical protein